jgi:hypothetical protein
MKIKYYTIIALHWVRYDVLWSTEKQYWPRPKAAVNISFQCSINTSYCTKWSAVIALLHLTYQVFLVPGLIFRDCLLLFFQIQKCLSWSIYYHRTLVQIHIGFLLHLLNICALRFSNYRVCVCVTSLQWTLKTIGR